MMLECMDDVSKGGEHSDPHPASCTVLTTSYCSKSSLPPQVCLQFLQGLTHRPFTQQAVKGGDKIDLGQV